MSLNWFDKSALQAMLKEPESEGLERKSFTAREKIAQTIAAFANDLAGRGKPSVIFIGLKDEGGSSGLRATDKMLRDMASLRENNILPLPVIKLDTLYLKETDTDVIALQVLPSKMPPVRYKGNCYVRIGPAVRRAAEDEERRLADKRRAGDLPEDMREIIDTRIEADLNMTYFKEEYLPRAVSAETLAENNRDIKTQMQSLRICGNENPTMAGLLIAGKNPRYWLPGAYIQFVRFDGKELTDPVKDQKEISGRLGEQIKEIEIILKLNITAPLEIAPPKHIKSFDYPFSALSQLVRNAILHRDYKSHAPVKVYWFLDRVEIQSPGGPYGKLNKENFGQEGLTDYRNPTLAEAFKNLGFVERFDFGLPKARKALKENGNPQLELDANQAVVQAVIRNSLP